MFRQSGHEVVGVDVSPDKVAVINAGQSPIVEPGLGELVADMAAKKRLRATMFDRGGCGRHELALVCVGTPVQRNGQPDFSAVERVGEQIGRGLRGRAAPLSPSCCAARRAGNH